MNHDIKKSTLNIIFVLAAITLIITSFFMRSGTKTNNNAVVFLPEKSNFDVNGPPIPVLDFITTNETAPLERNDEVVFKKKNKSKRKKRGGYEDEYDKIEPFLIVVDNDDDEVPTGIGVNKISIHASDALECRESVVNFVINATDGKDECNGLKRAFDKTCNIDSSEEVLTKGQEHYQEKRRLRMLPKMQKINQMTKMKEKYQLFLLENLCLVQRIWRFLTSGSMSKYSPTFLIEDQIVGQAYDDGKYLVDNDLDQAVIARRNLKRFVGIGKDKIRADIAGDRTQTNFSYNYFTDEFSEEYIETYLREDDSRDNDPFSTLTDKNNTNATLKEEKAGKQTISKPKSSLTLPTAHQHMSEQMLSETLLLQKEESTIGLAIKTAANASQSNLTKAAVDAVASSNAVKDTTAVVSAVLNDPTSVEARVCCSSILNVFHEICDAPSQEVVSDEQLFLIVFVLALCGMVKSVIRYFSIRWLPEAAGCILVGVLCGSIMSFFPHYDLSFDGDWFLRIMVPPIVFEAALSINKRSFNRHIVPIMMYAIAGTLLATVITALILHKGSKYGKCETIPWVESLTFGSLISSIDPIAVLSVLSNMGMTDTDTIYVVIFGESLLNDGVALVLYETLVHFLDESLVIDKEAIFWATIHFLVVAFGSLFVGIASGFASTAYFYLMRGCQTPLIEVLLFFCWAFIPYYISDGIGWSGIVAVVATGFIMDLYVVGEEQPESLFMDELSISTVRDANSSTFRKETHKRRKHDSFGKAGNLSTLAKTHVHFVAELLATMMETAIFAYLGLFLFSYRYHWNYTHTVLSIAACIISRAIMIPLLSLAANWVTKALRLRLIVGNKNDRRRGTFYNAIADESNIVKIDGKMQMILWVAGLRGAMSFALVENIPLYDAVTREGSKVKAELKAMTSATIVFTVFFLGGYTYYLMQHLGIAPNDNAHVSKANHRSRGSSIKDEGTDNLSTTDVDSVAVGNFRHRVKNKLKDSS